MKSSTNRNWEVIFYECIRYCNHIHAQACLGPYILRLGLCILRSSRQGTFLLYWHISKLTYDRINSYLYAPLLEQWLWHGYNLQLYLTILQYNNLWYPCYVSLYCTVFLTGLMLTISIHKFLVSLILKSTPPPNK